MGNVVWGTESTIDILHKRVDFLGNLALARCSKRIEDRIGVAWCGRGFEDAGGRHGLFGLVRCSLEVDVEILGLEGSHYEMRRSGG